LALRQICFSFFAKLKKRRRRWSLPVAQLKLTCRLRFALPLWVVCQRYKIYFCGVRQAWVHVLSFVDAESIANRVCLVSHAFHALATEPQLWRRLVLRDFPASASSADPTDKCNLYEGEPDGWRKTFYAHRWLQRSVHTNQSQPGRSRGLTALTRIAICVAAGACRSGPGSVFWATLTAASRPSWVRRPQPACGVKLGDDARFARTIAGRMLLGLGQITQKEVDRHGEAAMMIAKSSFKYAWCCDTTLVERERGISTCLYTTHLAAHIDALAGTAVCVVWCGVLHNLRCVLCAAWCSDHMEGKGVQADQWP
jgi:hypothetical protein